MVPEVPIAVRVRSQRDAAGVEVLVDVGHAGGDLGGGRRVGVEVALVEADRPDVHRDRPAAAPPPPAPARSSRRRCRPPAPARAASVLRGHGPGEDQRRLLVAGQHLGLDAQPAAYAVGEDRGVAGVAGGRGGAEAEALRRYAVAADDLGELVDRGERALQRLVGEHPGPVDALAEADHPRVADAPRPDAPSARMSAISTLIELVPQSMAATMLMRTVFRIARAVSEADSPAGERPSRTARTTTRRARRWSGAQADSRAGECP